MATPSVTVKVIREVDLDKVIGNAFREFCNEWVLATVDSIQGRSPHLHGNLEGSLGPGGPVTGVDSADPPRWAKVGTKVEYGFALNYPKSREPHYRHTRYIGDKTAGWFERGVDDSMPRISELVKVMAKDVEAGWRA